MAVRTRFDVLLKREKRALSTFAGTDAADGILPRTRALYAFAPIADEVVDMREVGSHGQHLIHRHQRHGMLDGGFKRGVALLHDVAVVVVEIVVQLPERWPLRAAGIVERSPWHHTSHRDS